jgi:FdrA protein
LERLLNELEQCKKRVIVNFLGLYGESLVGKNIVFTTTLEETALKTAEMIGRPPQLRDYSHDIGESIIAKAKQRGIIMKDTQKYVRGLFGGGTLAAEACIILQDMVSPIYGNFSLRGVTKIVGSEMSKGHCIIDMGADEFTSGKPHPMIAPEMRGERLLAEASDPEVAVILLDFVLGYGVHLDPAGSTITYIEMTKRISEGHGRYLPVIASVCGTSEDPQQKSKQISMLEQHDVIVLPNNAQAARAAVSVALRSRERHLDV